MSNQFHTEVFEGFEIKVFAESEDTAPEDAYDSGFEDEIQAIREGRLEWFCAKVSASLDGIELGADYLGCCCYANASEFLDPEGYYGDMRSEAVAQAKAKLVSLVAAAPKIQEVAQ